MFAVQRGQPVWFAARWFRKVEGYRGLAQLAVAIERELTDGRNKKLATTLSA